jgi:hypothetical protein
MFGMGLIEILMLVFMTGGATSDLVSVLPPAAYFKSRGIDINIDKAVELAAKDPVNGKAQIAQLLALRYLADEAAKLKASPNLERHRQTLTDIATGKNAQDEQGFAKDYAAAALARLDGTKLTRPAPRALRDEAFGWFPSNATLMGALDTREMRGDAPAKSTISEMFKLVPEEGLNQIFSAVEKVGNVRIDRIAFAYVDNPQDKQMGEIYVRITGKANPTWLLEVSKELKIGAKTSKGPGGETITKLLKESDVIGDVPGVMLIGDSELVIAGYPQKNQANHEDLLVKLLDLKGGKGRPASEGTLKAELAKIPQKACGLLVGSLPSEASQGAPFPMPVTISGHMLRVQSSLDVNLAGHMANNDDATQLVKTVSQFRQEGINSLKQLQGAPMQIPGLKVNVMIQMLESMQIEAQANVAKMRLLMPDDMLGGGSLFFGLRGGAVPMPPPKEKKEEK